MARIIGFAFGAASYLVFVATFLYAIGFVTGIGVPKTVDSGAPGPIGEAVVIDLLLLSLFALQHSGMARRPFKRWLTRVVPAPVERSLYVLLASLALIAIYWQWRPIPQVIWQIDHPQASMAVMVLSLAGWLLVLASTFLISHFELFGLRQVALHLAGRPMPGPQFRTPALYRLVRHPIYLGFIIAFWATPVMTAGHLLFAAVTTAYILVGIALEERDLVHQFGDEYRRYRAGVPMLLPVRPGRAGTRGTTADA